jgi:hypothetical protein
MPTRAEFDKMFSIPTLSDSIFAPGDYFDLEVPEANRVLITDIYIDNIGKGISTFLIMEQVTPSSFLIRYTFHTAPKQVTIINFTTGLKLGDEQPLAGCIRIKNGDGSQADILPRVNGIIVG